MTKQEFSKIAITMRTCYPRENILPNNDAMNTWYELLKDLPYEVIFTGLQKWTLTNKWSPAISDLRSMAVEVSHETERDWSEGWKEVQSAISCFGMYRPEEALDSMSPITRQIVKRLGWMDLCTSENTEVDRANFRMIYERESERARKDAQIPQPIKDRIGEIRNSFTDFKALEGGTR